MNIVRALHYTILAIPILALSVKVGTIHEDTIATVPPSASVASPKTSLWAPIIMYHHIRPITRDLDELGRDMSVTPEHFEDQIRTLKKEGFHFVTLSAVHSALLGKINLPERPIVLTFDDGYADNFTYAMPILKQEHVIGTEFVVTNAIGKRGYLSWDQVTGMQDSGTFTIESHTLNHSELPKLSPEHAWSEIKQSKDELERRLGKSVHFFCYPFGKYSEAIATQAQKAGYAAALTTQFGVMHDTKNSFAMPRVRFTNSDTGKTLEKKITLLLRSER